MTNASRERTKKEEDGGEKRQKPVFEVMAIILFFIFTPDISDDEKIKIENSSVITKKNDDNYGPRRNEVKNSWGLNFLVYY